MFHDVVRDRAVQASASAGAVVGVAALVGSDRFPGAFAAVAVVWAAITAAALARAVRTAG